MAGHVPSPERASSHGISLPHRVLSATTSTCVLGCTLPSLVLAHDRAHARVASLTFEVFTPPHLPSGFRTAGKSSPRLSPPYRVSPTDTARRNQERITRPVATLLLPRFLPLQRLLATRSHISQRDPNPLVTLRPQGCYPLDALLPSQLAELISSRLRSWGLPFEASFLFWCRTSSRMPHPSWSWVTYASL